MITDIDIGDEIIFKSATRSHCKKAQRKVTGLYGDRVTVSKYHGWEHFYVYDHEIIEVIKNEDTHND